MMHLKTTTTYKTSNIKKPYCKVCYDAGKTESEYTSHWVRSKDRTGKTVVICPTLLSTECRFCYKMGHTAKFCPTIQKNQKEHQKLERKQEYQKKTNHFYNYNNTEKITKKYKKKSVSLFEALDSDSEEETEMPMPMPTTNKINVSFPQLSIQKPDTTNETKTNTSWASIAQKEPEEKSAYEDESGWLKISNKNPLQPPPPRTPECSPSTNKYARCYAPKKLDKKWVDSWADESDTDTESESDAISDCEDGW